MNKLVLYTVVLFSVFITSETYGSCGLSPQLSKNGRGSVESNSSWQKANNESMAGCKPLYSLCNMIYDAKITSSWSNSSTQGIQGCSFYNPFNPGEESLARCDWPYVYKTSGGVDEVVRDLKAAFAQGNEDNWGNPPDTVYTRDFNSLDCDNNSFFSVPVPAITSGTDSKDECKGIGSHQPGSIIGCRDQSLSQKIEVAGTPFHLNYNSLRVNDDKRSSKIITFNVPFWNHPFESGDRWKLIGASAMLVVAGKEYLANSPGTNFNPSWEVTFQWDGKDKHGTDVIGTATGAVIISYNFRSGWVPEANTVDRRISVTLGSIPLYAQKMGGWTISEHHSYDKLSGNF